MGEKVTRFMKCVVCGNWQFTVLFSHHNNWKVGECSACGLVQVVPMPSAKKIGGLYHEDMDHFDPYVAQISVHHEYFRRKVKEIQQLLSPKFIIRNSKFKLLDIGCAMGVLLSEAKKQGGVVTGVDISADAVSYCKAKKLVAYAGTIQSVGDKLKKDFFDVVTAFEIIEHERDPLGMMSRVHQLLKKDGFALLTTPNHSSFWRKLMGKWWFGYQHPEHVTFWDSHCLTVLLKKAGFKNITVRHDEPRPFPLSFAFARSADYFPWAGWLLKPIGKVLGRWDIKNPINPFDDLIVVAQK